MHSYISYMVLFSDIGHMMVSPCPSCMLLAQTPEAGMLECPGHGLNPSSLLTRSISKLLPLQALKSKHLRSLCLSMASVLPLW